jgi:2-iminobutanoate/2-iminopropanoate deaminase
MRIQRYNPSALETPPKVYCQVIKVMGGRLVFVSGQASIDAKGVIVGKGDIEAQARQAFGNIEKALKAVGAAFENIVKLTIFMKDVRDRPKVAAIRAELFGEMAPTSTVVEVSGLAEPELLVEVEAIAVVE